MSEKMLKFVNIDMQMPAKRTSDVRTEDFKEIYNRFVHDKAKEQSSRCSQCGVPFCQIHCPLHNNIPDWLKLTAEGRLQEAHELALSTNNMPEICGSICPQDRLCEGNCVIERAGHGTVTIGSVEKYITDNAWEKGWIKPIKVFREINQSVGIIGAGPAGYTAGIYCSRARHDTLLISGILPGGQLMNTTDVENYPGFSDGIMGPDLMDVMRKQTEKMGTKIIDDEVTSVDFKNRPLKVKTASEEFEARAVIVCTGANPRKIGLEGEQTFAGKGVSYCATCDGAFFRDQELIVVGGGDSAMEEAIFLTKFASVVHIVHRKEEFRASKIMQERALSNEKIKVHFNSTVKEIHGDQKFQQVVLNNTKTNEDKILEAGGLFIAIGHEPNSAIFQDQIELDGNGYIIIKNNTETSVTGVFCAGDVHDHRYRQAVTAAGFGCMAAIDVDKYLSESDT